MSEQKQFQVPPGMVCVTSYGSIQMETVQWIWEMRSVCDKQGLHNVSWVTVPGTLVEKARNDAVFQMLKSNAQWLLQIDADMVGNPDAVLRILQTAYGSAPWADVVGAYCPLRGPMALPTIDRGDGTWQNHYPNSGIMEVIRTGAAFLLVKRHVFERIPAPWFRVRQQLRIIDALAEVDNWARIKNNGQNPFVGLPERTWEKLLAAAKADPSTHGQWEHPAVGEDSGFCDRVKAAGMRLAVDTDIVLGHLDKRVQTWQDHKAAVENIKQQHLNCVGVERVW